MNSLNRIIFSNLWVVLIAVSAGLVTSCSDNKPKLGNDQIVSSNGSEVLLDPRAFGFGANLQGLQEDLWYENESLSAEAFYRRYETEFRQYHIILGFHGDTVTAVDGAVYDRHVWENELEKNLTSVTNDHFKSQVVSRAYHRHILPITQSNPELDRSFQWFLFRYHVYLGSEIAPFKAKLSLYSSFRPFFRDKPYIRALSGFMAEVNAAREN